MQNVMSYCFYTLRLCYSRAILRIALLLIALACCALSMAAWSPIIRQFSPQDYAAGTQNWDMLEHTNGWIYVEILEITCYFNLSRTNNFTKKILFFAFFPTFFLRISKKGCTFAPSL